MKNLFSFPAECFRDNYGTGLGISFCDEQSGPLTAVVSMAEILDSRLCFMVDIRYSVTADADELEKKLRQKAESRGWRAEVTEKNPAFYRDYEDRIVKELVQICSSVYGRHLPPYCMGGGTYARKLGEAVGYGPGLNFQVKPCPPGHGRGHQPDECICIDNLVKAVEIYIKALKRLDEII